MKTIPTAFIEVIPRSKSENVNAVAKLASTKDVELLDAIQIVSFKWRVDSKIVEHRSFENTPPIIVCTHINKNPTFGNLKLTNLFPMNFELGRHMIWNTKLKEESRPSKKFPNKLSKK